MDAVVVGLGELCDVAEFDLVAGGANRVKLVSCSVRGAQEEFVESYAF